jgi:hypothetical protein
MEEPTVNVFTEPRTPDIPAGCVICPYPRQGVDGVWMWRLSLARRRPIVHEGYAPRYLTVELGAVRWYEGKWVAHTSDDSQISPEYDDSVEAVAWLIERARS